MSARTENNKTEYFSKALDFIDKADHLSYDKLCKRAVNNSEALIEILQGTEESVKFLSSRQIDREVVAGRVKNSLQRLHFNPAEDYYLALLLPRDADISLIHQRWKTLMMVYHPDRHSESTVSTEQHTDCAKRLNEIFSVLKDPKKKFQYDRQLDNPLKTDFGRPSFCAKPGKIAFGEMIRENYLVVALLLLLTAVASIAGFYFVTTIPKEAVAPGDSHSVYKSPSAGTDAAESVAGPVAYSQSPMKEQPKLSSSTRPYSMHTKQNAGSAPLKETGKNVLYGRVNGVLLAEEIFALINRLTQAYEKGDLTAYLSCYSQSAIEEDGLGYDEIKTYYGKLFASGGHHLVIGNMIILEGRESITVKGAFDEDGLAKSAESRASKGSVEMTLEREDGKLKIKCFRRMARSSSG